MIIYRNRELTGSSGSELFEVSLHTAGRNTFGFWKKDGALRCGFGLQKVTDAGTFPEGKQPAAIFRACAGGAYLLVCSDGECYVSAEGQSFLACGISFSCEPAFVRVFDEEPALLLSDGARTAILTASGLQAEAGVPPFECAGYAYERLWIVPAAQGSRLQFSAPGNIRDFTAGRGLGGTIDVPDEKGNIVGFVPYKNDVLLLRERGGQLLEADGDERDFAVTDLFSCGKICPKTAASASFGAVFMTEDGLYCWNGKLSAFAEEYACRIAYGADARGVAIGRNYVLESSVCSAYGRERALSAFTSDGEAVFLRRDACGLFAADGAVYCISGDSLYTLAKKSAKGEIYCWASDAFTPFGTRTLLREVRVRAEGDFILNVRSEDGARTVRIGSGSRVQVNLAGVRFRFFLEAERPGAVYSVAALCSRAEGG